MWATRFLTHTNNRQNHISVYLKLNIFDSKLEDKRFCTEWQQALPDFNLLLIPSWIEFWFVTAVNNILNVPPLSRTNNKSSYCDFVLHSHYKTWTCTQFYQYLLLLQYPYERHELSFSFFEIPSNTVFARVISAPAYFAHPNF
jgi:hypothetical protein